MNSRRARPGRIRRSRLFNNFQIPPSRPSISIPFALNGLQTALPATLLFSHLSKTPGVSPSWVRSRHSFTPSSAEGPLAARHFPLSPACPERNRAVPAAFPYSPAVTPLAVAFTHFNRGWGHAAPSPRSSRGAPFLRTRRCSDPAENWRRALPCSRLSETHSASPTSRLEAQGKQARLPQASSPLHSRCLSSFRSRQGCADKPGCGGKQERAFGLLAYRLFPIANRVNFREDASDR